ncbi:unnamed protein product, partial [Choristocarpus tenellus]
GWLTVEIGAAGRLRLWSHASSLLKEARSPALGGGGGIGARFYSAYIEASVLCGQPERGLEVLRELEAGGGGQGRLGRGISGALPPPDGRTYVAALGACEAVGGKKGVELALAVVQVAIGGKGAGGRLTMARASAVLEKAGEVCGALGAASASEALAQKAKEVLGLAGKEAP